MLANVSVDRDRLVAIKDDCSRFATNFDEELQKLVESAKAPFEKHEKSWEDPTFVAEISKGSRLECETIIRYRATYFQFGYPFYNFLGFGEKNLSISSRELESKFGISRVFFVDNLVAFVYPNGRVRLQPKKCLEGQDSVVVEKLSLAFRRHKLVDILKSIEVETEHMKRKLEEEKTFSFV